MHAAGRTQATRASLLVNYTVIKVVVQMLSALVLCCLLVTCPQVTYIQSSLSVHQHKNKPVYAKCGLPPCGSYNLPVGYWPRYSGHAGCAVKQALHGAFEVWCFCYFSRYAVSRVWQPPVSAMSSMSAALFMLLVRDSPASSSLCMLACMYDSCT